LEKRQQDFILILGRCFNMNKPTQKKTISIKIVLKLNQKRIIDFQF